MVPTSTNPSKCIYLKAIPQSLLTLINSISHWVVINPFLCVLIRWAVEPYRTSILGEVDPRRWLCQRCWHVALGCLSCYKVKEDQQNSRKPMICLTSILILWHKCRKHKQLYIVLDPDMEFSRAMHSRPFMLCSNYSQWICGTNNCERPPASLDSHKTKGRPHVLENPAC